MFAASPAKFGTLDLKQIRQILESKYITKKENGKNVGLQYTQKKKSNLHDQVLKKII